MKLRWSSRLKKLSVHQLEPWNLWYHIVTLTICYFNYKLLYTNHILMLIILQGRLKIKCTYLSWLNFCLGYIFVICWLNYVQEFILSFTSVEYLTNVLNATAMILPQSLLVQFHRRQFHSNEINRSCILGHSVCIRKMTCNLFS